LRNASPQLRLPYATSGGQKNGTLNKVNAEDQSAHRWYRFVLSFPPHLVRDYLGKFGANKDSRVLDPFSGTGTTLVECKKLGIPSVGFEAHPVAQFAAQVKLQWSVEPDALLNHARRVAEAALSALEIAGFDDSGQCFDLTRKQISGLQSLPQESADLLLTGSISPLPLHKTLILLREIEHLHDPRYCQHELLALARTAVYAVSNLHFGPEVGVQRPKADAAVIGPWLREMSNIADDLVTLRQTAIVPAIVHLADARAVVTKYLPPNSVDIVITSPPYPNEKDYTRTTRLESILLGFIKNKAELKALKKTLVRSNTRSVYKSDDDDRWIADHEEIQRVASMIERRRIQLGKTSGFERLYARVTKLYFGGMVRHLRQLTEVLKPGARLAYVVGDQASYLRVMIRTGHILADLAERLGFEVLSIDLFRTRLATATKEQLREEVVVLRWPGKVISRSRIAIHDGSPPPERP